MKYFIAKYASKKPDLTILIPALNEKLTIKRFIDWCKKGIANSNISAEIIIVDSSSDNTAEIALASGANVLKTKKIGLGQAYVDSIPFIRGKYVLMGDCDLTYDFRKIKNFVSAFKDGYEYVMGSRFKGYIQPKSMPVLHRYFGTPLTTWILNLIYRTNFTDIHCGMRGITLSALKKIKLESKGWEYASEMVLKSKKYDLKTKEVPVRFYKDVKGRQSHLKRSGFLTPWLAGWNNLKIILIYTPETFMIKPGVFFILISLFSLYLLFFSSIDYKDHFLGFVLTLMLMKFGFFLLIFGIFFYIYNNAKTALTKFILNKFSYNFGFLCGFFSLFLGSLITIHEWFNPYNYNKYFIFTGSSLVIFGIMFITSTIGMELLKKKNV